MNAVGLFQGFTVYVEPPRPRYTLPGDVPPPPGMTREEFMAWSHRVCGFAKPILANGQVTKTPMGLHMNAATWQRVRSAFKLEGGAL